MITSSGLSKSTFYGKLDTQLSIKVRLSRKEKEYKKWPAPTPYRPTLGGPSSWWKIFKTLKTAFDFARSVSCDLHVFSCESEGFYNKSGQRLFLVTSYDQFWHYYRQLGNPQRHHYEVIPEGSVCHLYFDLEFSKIYNPDKNGDAMVEIFIKYINSQLDHVFNVKCSRNQVLQLDSSTEEKFSQHLVYHLENTVFQNNIHAGHFVHLICNQLLATTEQHSNASDSPVLCKRARTDEVASAYLTSSDVKTKDILCAGKPSFDKTVPLPVLTSAGLDICDLQMLLVKNKDGHNTLFCDQGVYTKNRNFRLFLSCKLGKNNPLVVARGNQYQVNVPADIKRSREEQLFLDSLITNIRYKPSLKILSMPVQVKQRNVSAKMDIENLEDTSRLEYFDGYKVSPYPELDAFITSCLTQGGTQGYIRRWTYFSSGELMVYDIAHNRWCDNIKRQHKSNNVIYVADIRRGVYYQKCHDPQCKAINYKSKEYPLPKEVLPVGFFDTPDNPFNDLEFLNDVPDADLLLAASQIEMIASHETVDVQSKQQDEAALMFDDLKDEDLLEALELLERNVDNCDKT